MQHLVIVHGQTITILIIKEVQNEKVLSIITIYSFMGGVEASDTRAKGELQVFIFGNTKGETYRLRATLISIECWDAFPGGQRDDDHPITSAYNHNNVISSDSTDNVNGGHIGLDLCYSGDPYLPMLGLGKYKIDVVKKSYWGGYEEVASFTMDYRTSAYPEQNQDIDFSYYVDLDELYAPDGTIADTETCWDLSDQIDWSKNFLQPYDPHNLSINSGGNYPHLSWGTGSSAMFFDVFEIYRKIGDNKFATFNKIAELNSSSTSFIDSDYVIGKSIKLTYKIRSRNGSLFSNFTNEAYTYGDLYKQSIDIKNYLNELYQNYPNPFNPSTTITYSIKNQVLVNLKVYDSIGREVSELVNEVKEAGIHQVDFNAYNLPSGIYIYKITADQFTSTKKLLLIK